MTLGARRSAGDSRHFGVLETRVASSRHHREPRTATRLLTLCLALSGYTYRYVNAVQASMVLRRDGVLLLALAYSHRRGRRPR